MLAAAQAALRPRHAIGRGCAARCAIAGLDPELIQVPTVPIRGSDGQPRPLAEIDAEVAALVEQAIAAGRRCLVHVLAGSKTGLLAPSFATAHKLTASRAAWSTSWSTPVRCAAPNASAPASRRAGWSVTGSKFFGGPPFAGALLAPRRSSHARPSCRRSPLGLADYFSRAEWPDPLQHLTGRLADRATRSSCRWQAALWEMRALHAVPQEQRLRSMTELAAAIGAALAASRHLRPLAVNAFGDWPQTIFLPFEVLARPRAAGSRWTWRRSSRCTAG